MDASKNECLARGLEYLAGHMSVIPVRTDGSKAPALASWDEYKQRRPTETEVQGWFSNGNSKGVAIIGGKVSENLNILDVEFPDFAADWCELVEAETAGIINNLPQVITPGKKGIPGKHFYFRSQAPLGTSKLARLTEAEALERTGDKGKTTAIEIKAEGGYCLAPGCPATCHESGRLYQHVGGPFIEETPVLDDAQVEVILSCARALDHAKPHKVFDYVGSSTPVGEADRPGDVFNRRADWMDVLDPHGWVLVRSKAGVLYLRRPGKIKGISATIGFCKSDRAGDLMCVFSSNASPLEIPVGKDHQCFSRFAAYAILNHKGDFRAAAADLASKGYGFDAGISAAEQYAADEAAKIEEIDDKEAWTELRRKMTDRNQDKSWGLSDSEMDVVADVAKKQRIDHDPKLFGHQVKREVNESIGTPDPPPNGNSDKQKGPAWKLIIIKSKPPAYLLRSPRWSSRPEVRDNGGFVKLTLKELKHWSGIIDAAMAQADIRIPDKCNGWARILETLMIHAEKQESAPEEKRPVVVADFLWNILRSAKEIQEDPDGTLRYGQGSPKKLADGRIIVKLGWMLKQGVFEAEPISRKELMETVARYGMKPDVFGEKNKRSRWWTIDQTNIQNLSADVLGEP